MALQLLSIPWPTKKSFLVSVVGRGISTLVLPVFYQALFSIHVNLAAHFLSTKITVSCNQPYLHETFLPSILVRCCVWGPVGYLW